MNPGRGGIWSLKGLSAGLDAGGTHSISVGGGGGGGTPLISVGESIVPD